MNGRPASISVRQLSQAVHKAVAEAQKKHAKLQKAQLASGVVIDPAIIGFIMQEAELLGALTLAEAEAFAGEVAAGLQGAVQTAAAGAAAGAGSSRVPAVRIGGGHVTMGFFPDVRTTLIQE